MSSTFPVAGMTPSKPNAVATSSDASSSALVTPPELEQTLSMLSSHRTVLGYLLLSRTTPVKIIRHSGVVFEGEQGRKYAAAISKMVEAVHSGLEFVGAEGSDAVSLSLVANDVSILIVRIFRMKCDLCESVQNGTNL